MAFENIISSAFKDTFNDAITSLLQEGSLSVPCTIKYGITDPDLCSNCIFDNLSNRSSNIYNGSGPISFSENSICPVCNGRGLIDSDASETVHLGVIFDSKYFLNWNSKSMQIPDGLVQTICRIELLPKIKNANSIIFNTGISNYGHYHYVRDGEPNPCGLGDHKFIITMWKKQ
jgi:hypothetical protein